MQRAPVKILVADDEPSDLAAMVQALTINGDVILTATDGRQAKHMAVKEHPDLVVLDAVMPRGDGFEVASFLRNHPETKDTPIIVVTVMRSEEAAEMSFHWGADDFIAKPIVPANLRAKVETWLLRREERSPQAGS